MCNSDNVIHAKRVDQFIALFNHFASQYKDVKDEALEKMGLIYTEYIDIKDIPEGVKEQIEIYYTEWGEFPWQ